MGKRLSKARRAKALNRKLVIARAQANDDSCKLQQGRVASPLTRPSANLKGLALPRGIPLDGQGRRGKIVDGKFKPTSPHTKKPFSSK